MAIALIRVEHSMVWGEEFKQPDPRASMTRKKRRILCREPDTSRKTRRGVRQSLIVPRLRICTTMASKLRMMEPCAAQELGIMQTI